VLIGLDVGTSGVKGVAIGEGGNIVAVAEESYSLSAPLPGWAEQDPEDWWRASQRVLAQLPEGPVGLSGQMHGLVVLGEHEVFSGAAIHRNGGFREHTPIADLTVAHVGQELRRSHRKRKVAIGDVVRFIAGREQEVVHGGRLAAQVDGLNGSLRRTGHFYSETAGVRVHVLPGVGERGGSGAKHQQHSDGLEGRSFLRESFKHDGHLLGFGFGSSLHNPQARWCAPD